MLIALSLVWQELQAEIVPQLYSGKQQLHTWSHVLFLNALEAYLLKERNTRERNLYEELSIYHRYINIIYCQEKRREIDQSQHLVIYIYKILQYIIYYNLIIKHHHTHHTRHIIKPPIIKPSTIYCEKYNYGINKH